MQHYWEEHPLQYQIIQIAREGQWITHVFEWFFMMVSRLAGYLMTIAIGYLIYYAIEFKHGLDAVSAHPQFPDSLASLSNVVINVGPELVFPGVVVMAIRCLTMRRWLDGILYGLTSVFFAILTMTLLNAFMDNDITSSFLSIMLFWRAAGALFYTVVIAYCGEHSGLDLRSLLKELDSLREQLDGGQQTVSSLEQEVSSLKQQVSTGQQEVSRLAVQLQEREQEVSTLRVQLDSKQVEVDRLAVQLDSEQRIRESLQQHLAEHLGEQEQEVSTLRVQVREHLESGQQEVSSVHVQLDGKQQIQVSSGQRRLDTEQVDTGQEETGQSQHPLSNLDSGHVHRSGRVIRLDRTRARHSGQQKQEEPAIAGQIRNLLQEEPGLSARAIAIRVGCSPTTAAKWKAIIEEEQRVQDAQEAECVNE